MAKAFIDDTHLTDIADAIRATLDESRQYLPSEMAAAIDSIPIMAQLNRKKYFQAVPSGAASGYANIEKIEGNTVAWNQLLKSGKLVDMGLPSGLLWATCNIDITQDDGFAASPFQYGCTMFSWGNIEGHNTPASGTTFDYDWGSVNAQEPWYEGQVYGSTPGSTLTANIVAGDTYDAARYNLGSLFKMPSSAQFQELFNNCDFVQADGTTVIASSVTDKRVTVNGIVGIYLKSKVNGNLIFFSASGIGDGSSWNYSGANGYYWSSSFHSSRNARYLRFGSGGVGPQNFSYRYYGFAVRAVVNPNTIDIGHNNHKYYVTKDINHDLTAIFGAGNEPTTVEEFEAWLAQNGLPSVAVYNAGELISCKMNGMQTEDSSQQTLDTIALDVTTITGINQNTNTREVCFPYGLNKAIRVTNNVKYSECDELSLSALSALKKINYHTIIEGNVGLVDSYTNLVYITFKKPANSKGYGIYPSFCLIHEKFGCAVERIGAYDDARNIGRMITSAHTYYVWIGFPLGTTLADAKAALVGTSFVYELATPITYTDLQDANGNPLNPRYKVEQGGTEQVLPANTSTPTTVAPTLTTTYTKDNN